MKKILSFSMALVLLICFASCGYSGATIQDVTIDIGATTMATNEPTSGGEEIWIVTYSRNEFNEPTNEQAITNDEAFVGTFSNSATTNSLLKARLFFNDYDETIIRLYEYGTNDVKTSYSKGVWYKITVKDSYGYEKSLSGISIPGRIGILVLENHPANISNIKVSTYIEDKLRNDEDLKIYMAEEDRPGTNYLFEVEAGNFAELAH